jgi:hypothetical protein
MQRFKYPLQVESMTDYIRIRSFDYQARGKTDPGRGPSLNRGANGPSNLSITLPIPELPNMISRQKYGAISGALNNALATGLGSAYAEIDAAVSRDGVDGIDVGTIAERLRNQIEGQGGGSPIIREQAARLAGALSGITGSQFQSLATGEITNPNIELLYTGPTLRSFSMNWTFAPKSRDEAEQCYEIVRALKRAHLPSGAGGAGMLKVPEYFLIDIYVDNKISKYYQKFQPCFLEGISVKQDSNGNHMTLPNGEPCVSSLSLVFKELRIITREDHEDSI